MCQDSLTREANSLLSSDSQSLDAVNRVAVAALGSHCGADRRSLSSKVKIYRVRIVGEDPVVKHTMD